MIGIGLGLLGLVGCIPAPDEGTAVGNPTILAMGLSDGEDVEFVSATGTASVVRISSPEDIEILAHEKGVDLRADHSLTARSGEWTALTMEFRGGVTLSSADLSRTIPLPDIVVVGQFSTVMDGPPLLLQFGGRRWIDDDMWRTGTLEEVAQLLAWGTALYTDRNGNFTLDVDEERAGELACERCDLTSAGHDTGR